MKKKQLLTAVFLSILFLTCIVISCKKRDSETTTTNETLSPVNVQAAKDWYSSHLQTPSNTQSTLSIGTQAKKILNPIWTSAKYVNSSTGEKLVFVQAPGYTIGTPGINFARAFVFTQDNNGNINNGKILEFYSKTNNLKDLTSLIQGYNSSSITNFDGAIISYDINYNYNYKGSRLFQNGKLVEGGSAVQSMAQTSGITQVNAKRVASTRLLDEGSGNGGCTYYFWDTYVDDELVDEYFLYSTGCDGGGGGGSGGGSSTTPPPGDAVGVVPQLPSFPPDPCDQLPIIKAEYQDPNNTTDQSDIKSDGQASGVEYGAEQNLQSVTNDTYMFVTPRTDASTNSFQPHFTWDKTNGFTIGVNHYHPGGTAPSPADAVWGASNVYSPLFSQNPQFPGGGYADNDFYESHFSLTTTTTDYTYVLTVSDWSSLAQLANNFNDDPTSANDDYVSDAVSHGGDAEYALLDYYGSAITLFRAPAGTNDFVALKLDVEDGTTVPINCPN